MECEKVEAMLNEAGVNWTDARILFRHINQFLEGLSLNRITNNAFFFSGIEFVPTIDVYTT
jgi:hypothetical protein